MAERAARGHHLRVPRLPSLRPLLRRPLLGDPGTRRRLLHGDWHPLVRDPIDLLRLHYAVGGIVFLAMRETRAGLSLLFSAVAVLVVRAIDPPRRFDIAFLVAMFFNGWGDALHLFRALPWYDNLVHTTLPLAFGPLGYIALVRLDVVPTLADDENTPRRRFGMALIATFIGLAAAAIYEIYEFSVDRFLGANLFISEADTINDLFDGLVGAGIGGLLLAMLARRQVPSRRGPLTVHGHAGKRSGPKRPPDGHRAVEDEHEQVGPDDVANCRQSAGTVEAEVPAP